MPISPKSLQNLEARGRTPDWDEPKRRRYLSVTNTGFNGALKLARSLGCNSVSDLLEEIGRRNLVIAIPKPKEPSCDERVEAAIASVLPTIPIKSRVAIAKAFKKLSAKLAAESAL